MSMPGGVRRADLCDDGTIAAGNVHFASLLKYT